MRYLHTMVRVKDLDASMAFYRLLGLEEIRRIDNEQGRFSLVFMAAEGDEAAAGKRVGKDAAAGKETFVSLLGIERARAQSHMLVDQAIAHLHLFERDVVFAAIVVDARLDEHRANHPVIDHRRVAPAAFAEADVVLVDQHAHPPGELA